MSHDLVLLQEHWLRESQFHRITKIPCDNYASILSHVSGIDNHVFLSNLVDGVTGDENISKLVLKLHNNSANTSTQ